MRQPKTFLLLSVVVAVLFLGVAYAAIQNVTLNISGNVIATGDQANFRVAFTGEFTSEGDGQVNVSIQPQSTTASISVSGLTKKGQKVIVKIPVKNYSTDLVAGLKSDLDISISGKNPHAGDGYSDLVDQYTNMLSIKRTDNLDSWPTRLLNPGEETTIELEISLNLTPIQDHVWNIQVTYTAMPKLYS